MKRIAIIIVLVIASIAVLASGQIEEDTRKTGISIFSNIKNNDVGDFGVARTHNKVYLAAGEVYHLDDKGYVSYNTNVATVSGDVVTGVDVGTTYLVKNKSIYEVEVSDLFVYPHVDGGEKIEIPCGYYTQEMNEYLDTVLKTKIEDKGFGTRAGCVEAARFLLLQFPYKMHYFSENGRLPYCDGEGRYHHYGLYLNEYKAEVDNLYEKAVTGPIPWGCPLFNTVTNFYQDNSLDCSGFVTWVLFNGGCDPGDLGAGPADAFDCSDLGPQHKITRESLDEVKVGDLFAENGHIAIMIGRKDDLIYIAESNSYINVRAKSWTYDELIHSAFYAWIGMDEFYNYQDGKLTDYWD